MKDIEKAGLLGLILASTLTSSCATASKEERDFYEQRTKRSLYGANSERSKVSDLRTTNLILGMSEKLFPLMDEGGQEIERVVLENIRPFDNDGYQDYGSFANKIGSMSVGNMEYGSLMRIYTFLKDLKEPAFRNRIGGGLEGDVADTRSEWGGTISLLEGKTNVEYYLDEVVRAGKADTDVAEPKQELIPDSDSIYHRIFRSEPHHSTFHQHRKIPGPSLNVVSMGRAFSFSGDIYCLRDEALRQGQSHEFVFTREGEGMFNVAYYFAYRTLDENHVDAFVVNLGDYSYDVPKAKVLALVLRKELDSQIKPLKDK